MKYAPPDNPVTRAGSTAQPGGRDTVHVAMILIAAL